MSLTLTITSHWEDTKRLHVVGTLQPSGSYVSGGDTVPFNDPLIKSASAPIWFSGQFPAYNCVGLPGVTGSTPPNAKLQIYTDSTGAELSAAAYPAALLAAPVTFYAIFRKHR
jgi:hypothetical protein